MIKSSQWRAALAATAATFVAAVPLANAQAAYADAPASVYQPYPPELNTATVPAGGVIYFVAEGFEPGEVVTAALVPQSSTTLSGSPRSGDGEGGGDKCKERDATYRADARGTVSGCFQVPKKTPPGPYLFTLTGEESGSVSAPVTVTAKNGPGNEYGNGPGNEYGNGHGPGERSADGASLPLEDGAEGRPGTVKVAGNGKTLALRTGAAEEQPGSVGTASQQGDLAPAGYDAASQVSGSTVPAETGSGTNWALAGGAAGLAAIAVKAVTVVRRRHTRTEQG
ncbi:hypothetical protein E4N62_03545 [Streptomyces sp. MNU76]|uniref:hypothetical protein n=1 Tax=Streptomyces sp. MNU76 TaxID=2560026 RepID=UPI001E410D16|nr:hypothetical protein [Streptomyces sp. MNU76]MCC9704416.1 hypothetical protein [Streptomyces sp. MNU76]